MPWRFVTGAPTIPESRFSPDRRLVSTLLVTVCRLLTGVRSRWHSEPQPEVARIYYANHSGHLDGLVIWSSLPPQIRAQVHPVAAADYWLGSRLRRYLALRIFRAVPVNRRPPADREDQSDATRKDVLLPLRIALDNQHSLILFPEGSRLAVPIICSATFGTPQPGFLGGLCMSGIKRDRGVKDVGAMPEGHGGMMDRIDSLCFAAPVFFHVVRFFYT